VTFKILILQHTSVYITIFRTLSLNSRRRYAELEHPPGQKV